ncbi:DUF454 domain-containing protein [Aliidiomarina taiwanensis]|uniref:Inner membrane protein n=1 Tax=Aliidiomarina taiwanensis TaxID=946228 RepID=A0A432X7D3_9GAMM|nr:YbaN family protein [Aliidiomarina taiwanensis]RUO42750.1 DUF454 domain-containing protein [Aliidiomarina taiwanensis]
MHLLRTVLWRLATILAVILALIGVPLPGLPTVPFLILAAWCAGKGWPRLELWLLAHPTFGPPIRHWRAQGVVPRKAKYLASGMIALSLCLLWLSAAPKLIATAISVFVVAVLVWLWRRPEQPSSLNVTAKGHPHDNTTH